jgi:hypothetical protein
METISNLASGTMAALARDYYLWVGIFAITLAFGIYVQFFPSAIDFFTNPPAASREKKQESDARIRSEPPVNQPSLVVTEENHGTQENQVPQ